MRCLVGKRPEVRETAGRHPDEEGVERLCGSRLADSVRARDASRFGHATTPSRQEEPANRQKEGLQAHGGWARAADRPSPGLRVTT